MAALDFPASPSNGATYTGPGGVVWTWDGSKWVTQGIATAYLPLAGGQLTGPLGAISGGPPTASINFGGTANTGLYGNANLVGIMSGGQAKFTVDGTVTSSQNPIALPGAPTLPAHAATMAYVDGKFPVPLATGVSGVLPVANGGTGAATGAAGPYLPLAGGTVTGPVTVNGLMTATGGFSSGAAVNATTTFVTNAKGSVFGSAGGAGASGSVTQADANIMFYNAGGSNWAGMGTDTSGSMWFRTNASSVPGIRIPAGGSEAIDFPLGAGVWVGDHNVFVNNTARLTVANNSGLACQIANWSVGGASLMVSVSQTGTSEMYFGFWNGSANNVVGNITTNGSSVNYGTTSDARLKSEPVPLEDSGPLIDQLSPVTFNWLSSPDGPPQHGFVAQDMYSVYPQPVNQGNGLEPGEEGFVPWSLDPSQLVPLLTAEIKSLRARVAALEGVPA